MSRQRVTFTKTTTVVVEFNEDSPNDTKEFFTSWAQDGFGGTSPIDYMIREKHERIVSYNQSKWIAVSADPDFVNNLAERGKNN